MTQRTRILILAAAAAAVLLAVVLTVVLCSRGASESPVEHSPVTIGFYHGWNLESEVNAVSAVLFRFRSLYPHITVVPTGDEARALGADVSVRLGPERPRTVRFAAPPSAWTGSLWVLAADTDALDALAAVHPQQTAALRAGSCEPAAFRTLLAALPGLGWTPITLGNSHGWPYVLWLQHWTAALSGPESVSTLPDLADDSAMLPIRTAYEELTSWKTNGWFVEEVWPEGWARGLLPLNDGTAAFALVSPDYFAPITDKTRDRLEFLPFPFDPETGPWTIGSALFIGVNADSVHTEEAELLVRFLTSPGITQELTRLTDRPFFAWEPATGRSPEVVAGWMEAAVTPEYDAIVREFTPR